VHDEAIISDMISTRYKGHEERITSAVCAADLHVKLDQMPLQLQEGQRLLPSLSQKRE
jgi:hypothetical protein